MQITKHFKRQEFACKCGKCGKDDIDVRLVQELETIRQFCREPIYVNSGCRCEEHNRNVNGAKNSAHIAGKAADVRIDGLPPEAFAYIARRLSNSIKILVYPTFCHVELTEKKEKKA